jgi:hypothetical protein
MFYHDMRTPVPLLPDIRFLWPTTSRLNF